MSVNGKMLLQSIFMLALTTANVAFAGTNGVVQADSLRLRSAPSDGASVLWRLRINTAVEIIDERDEWVQIQVRGRPESASVKGWTSRSLVGTNELSRDTLLKEAESTAEPTEAIHLLERALAIDGQDRTRWQDLLDLYTRVGDVAGIRRVERHLKGANPIYFARCTALTSNEGVQQGNVLRAELVARLSGDQLEPLTVAPFDEGKSLSLDEANHLMKHIGAATWYMHNKVRTTSSVHSYPMHGTPFAAPFLVHFWNELGGTPWSTGESRAGPDNEYRIGLGPCYQAGVWLTTEPITLLPSEPISLDETANLLKELKAWRGNGDTYGISVSRPLPDRSWRQLELTIPWAWMSCDGGSSPRNTTAYALMHNGEIVMAMGGGWGEDTDPGSVTGAQWFQIDRSSETHFLGVMSGLWYVIGGHAFVHIDADGKVTKDTVLLEGWGC